MDEVILGGAPDWRFLYIGFAAMALAGRLLGVKSLRTRLSSEGGSSGLAFGVAGGEKSVTSSPALARVDEGVMAPGSPVSGRVEASNEGGTPPPGEVGGDDEREVRAEADDPGCLPEALELSTDPAGLFDLAPALPVDPTPGTADCEGMRFPIRPRFSETLR